MVFKIVNIYLTLKPWNKYKKCIDVEERWRGSLSYGDRIKPIGLESPPASKWNTHTNAQFVYFLMYHFEWKIIILPLMCPVDNLIKQSNLNSFSVSFTLFYNVFTIQYSFLCNCWHMIQECRKYLITDVASAQGWSYFIYYNIINQF